MSLGLEYFEKLDQFPYEKRLTKVDESYAASGKSAFFKKTERQRKQNGGRFDDEKITASLLKKMRTIFRTMNASSVSKWVDKALAKTGFYGSNADLKKNF